MPLTKHLTQKITKRALENELEKNSESYHLYGAWIAIFADPLFGLTDYLNMPYAWVNIFILRIWVAVATIITLFLWKKYKFSSQILIFVPFFLISLQNSYTFALIKQTDFIGHCLNYVALFIAGGMFILWKWQISIVVILLSAVAKVTFFSLNPQLNIEQSFIDGCLLLILIEILFIILVQTRYSLTIQNIKSKLALVMLNDELAQQNIIIERKNKDITDSIHYAQRIQSAMLLLDEQIKNTLDDNYFILFKPRDVVSGDFYWFAEKEEKIIVIAADCTGHGVPGAFMSMVGDSLLNSIIHDKEIHQPDIILNELHKGIRIALKQEETANRDGMDLSMVVIDKKNKIAQYAGAKNPIIYIQNNQLFEIKGNKMPIGGEQKEEKRVFTVHNIDISQNTMFYLFTDGFQDQFGGEFDKKFMISNLRELFLKIHLEDTNTQQKILDETITNWIAQGKDKQIDDITVIGVKV